MHSIRLLCIVVVATLCGSHIQSESQSSTPLKKTRIESYVSSAFLHNGTTGSLVLAGQCEQTLQGDVVSTEPIMLPDPDSFRGVDQSLNALSRTDPSLVWTKEANGFITVRDNQARASVLKLRLRRVELVDVVNLDDAVNKLLSNPEIRAYLKQRNIEMATVFTESYKSNQMASRALSASPNAIKISRVLSNITLADSLDYIVRLFPGIWIYSECPGRISITVDPTGTPSSESVPQAVRN